MIYTPQKNPKEAIILITIVVLTGIVGGYLISPFLMVVALLFWMQYTAILSYLQFKKKRKLNTKSLTGILLSPQIRFFLFEFLAVIGTGSIFKYRTLSIGAAALIAWWLFAYNFYYYYQRKRK